MTRGLPPPEAREAALYRHLKELGLSWKTVEHAPVFTVEEARAVHASLPGGHTKNLFLKDRRDGLCLVVAREDLRVDLNALAKQLGAGRFSFAAESLLEATLRVPAGSVTPFAVIHDAKTEVRVVLDAGLMALEPLYFHPLRNDRTTAIASADLLRFLESTGHKPLITELPVRC